MRVSFFAMTCAALALGACETGMEVAFEPVTTEAGFNERIVGKDLTYPGGAIAVNPDGTLGGSIEGNAVDGAWSWTDGQFCRELSIGSQRVPRECQTPEVAGDRVRFERPDGSYTNVATLM